MVVSPRELSSIDIEMNEQNRPSNVQFQFFLFLYQLYLPVHNPSKLFADTADMPLAHLLPKITFFLQLCNAFMCARGHRMPQSLKNDLFHIISHLLVPIMAIIWKKKCQNLQSPTNSHSTMQVSMLCTTSSHPRCLRALFYMPLIQTLSFSIT
jgi:hypothetical protein